MNEFASSSSPAEENSHRPGEALYQSSKERFGLLLAENMDLAIREYGFSLLYSMDPADSMHFLNELGFEPGSWEERFQLAVYTHKRGKLDEARSTYEDLLSERKDRKEIHFNLAALELGAGALDQARLHLETFQSWLESLPQESQAAIEWREMASGLREKIK